MKMKREEILFYLTGEGIHFYLSKNKRDLSSQKDTSLFFKYGEISNVKRCAAEIAKIVAKMNFGLYYLKPNVYVLYNDVCACDAKYLYRGCLAPLGANKLFFVSLVEFVKKIRNDKKLVIADKGYYTLVERREKCKSLQNLDFEPIVIGETGEDVIHYADKDVIWKTFKSCFTNGENYDIMDIGDDVV